VDPWGTVLAQADNDTPGAILAGIDPGLSAKARARLPSLTHDRPFDGP
jgi:predicted amidohydrolase